MDHQLSQVQRWMQMVITHPDGILAGIGSEAARGQIDIPPEQLESIVLPSTRQSSLDRLQIYANAYYARLLECLREEFPALVHALGAEVFDGFAFGYLQEYPSESYTLANLGRHFPQYLTETRPEELTEPENGPSWADFLIDLATVERTYSEVFDGPGIESRATLQVSDLENVSPEQWPNSRLVPVPCLRLLTLRYPVHLYISAVRHQTEAVIPEPEPTCLVVTRREFLVRRAAVSRSEFELLQALVAGETIGSAIGQAAQVHGDEGAYLADHLHQWFRNWTESVYFQAVEV